ncbi:MAG: PAS domain S-box protein [Nitrospirae bacterium]|nr:MAG: PAS domain S-box protein [Nitrospirota bacterium]
MTELDMKMQNNAEGATREREELFRLMFQNHNAIMLLLEPLSGHIVEANHAAEIFYGYPREVLTQMSIQDINTQTPEEIAGELQKAVRGKRNHFVFPHRLADGEIRTVEVYSSPIEVDGTPLLFSVIHDISERARTEQKLADSSQFNEQILSASPVGIVTYDVRGQCISANDQAARLIGATREQVLRQNFRGLESWSRSGLLEHAEKTLATGEPGRCIVHHVSTFNRAMWIDCLFSRFSAGGVPHLLIAFADITENKLAEDKIRQLLNEQKIIFDNIAVGIGYFKNRVILSVNNALERMFGYTLEELQGETTMLLYRNLEEYRRVGEEAYPFVDRGEVYSTEVEMRKKDGTMFWCNIVGQAVDRGDPQKGSIWMLQDVTSRKRTEESLRVATRQAMDERAKTEAVIAAIGDGISIQDREFRIMYQNEAHKKMMGEHEGRHCYEAYEKREHICEGCPVALSFEDGRVNTSERSVTDEHGTRCFSISASPLKDAEGEIIAGIEVVREITLQKRTEEEIKKAEKLESVGILAGGIAHDFNNLLQAILGNIMIAEMQGVTEEQRTHWLRSAEDACEMAHELTKRLIIFSKGGDPVKRPEPLAPLIKEPISLAVNGLGIVPEYDFPREQLSLVVDAGQIRQVFKNLAVNAVEAMPGGGRLVVTARRITIPEQDSVALPSGAYAEIILKDSGIGIPPESLGKVFDPYFSTKDRGSQKGMGLGLTVSDAIIRKHGGRITVESEVGRGTTFHVYLPLAGTGTGQNIPETAQDQ